MAILDQESAKKFLCGSGAEKYAFFKKATELARIDAIYRSTREKIDELHGCVEGIRNALNQKREMVVEAKNKVKEYGELDKLKSKLQELERLFAWSFYKEKGSEYRMAAEAVAKCEAKVKQLEEEIAAFAYGQESTMGEEANLRQKTEELTRALELQTKHKQRLESQFKQQMVPVKQQEKEKQMLRKDRKETKQQLVRSQERIHEMSKEIGAKSGPGEAELVKALNDAAKQLRHLEEENLENKQAVSNSWRAYEELTPHVRDASVKVNCIQGQLGDVTRRIRELDTPSADSLSILGPNAKKVHEMVSEESGSPH